MVHQPAAFMLRAYDYLVAIAFGGVAGLAAWWIVPESLPGVVVMLLGMGVGVVAAIPVLAVASAVLGGFEVLVMSMQIGMVAGMVGAMLPSGRISTVVFVGAAVGVVIHAVLHLMDRAKRGEVIQ